MDYAAAIRPVCDLARRALAGELPAILHGLRAERRERGKMDARDNGQFARQAVNRAAAQAARALDPHALREVARRFGERTSDFQRAQLQQQIHHAMGISIAGIEKPTRDRIEGFAAQSVDLISTIPDRYFDRVRQDVQEAYEIGRTPDDLSADLQDRFDMSERDADRIARDQIGKLNAAVNQDRQEALGVTGYIWRTMNDERVREEHAALEGQRFEWGDAPAEGAPGEAVQCRCYAEPDLAPLLGGDEE